MFLFFWRGFERFLMYSRSESFRELKNAIKNHLFLYLRGSGGQIKFLIETRGKILVPAEKNIGLASFLYMGGCVGGG